MAWRLPSQLVARFSAQNGNFIKLSPKYAAFVQQTRLSSSVCTTPMPEFEGKHGIKSYEDLYRLSLDQSDIFWGTLAKSRLQWFREFDKVSDSDMKEGRIQWFLNGKLNASVNCIDRHYYQTPNKVALIWEKDEPGEQEYITYKQLYQLTCQVANTFKYHGVSKGDRVVIYMPGSPLSVATMLACARIGAQHSVVFAGFSDDALASRIQDADASTVVTCDQAMRGGKAIDLKKTVDDAVAKCPSVKQVFYTKRTGASVPIGKLDISLEEEMEKQPKECDVEVMDSEDLLFLLYTSGSTGQPKGVAHSQAGYLLYTTLTHKYVFDYQEGDIYGCVADIGWITGHSYVVYGPLSNGATTVLFESTPTYPNPGRYWETVERLKMNQLYLAPTALRLLLKYDDRWVKDYDRSTLRTLGCVGEPLNHEAWEWYYNLVGEQRCPIVDTWWQTETGGICITPRPSAPGAVIKPAMPMRPFLGIEAVLCDEKGKELKGNDVSGALCIKRPWPGIARTIFGDHQRFLDTYFRPFPGMFYSGDGAHRNEEGFYSITGRMDDVINVSGHRLGTAEIEDLLVERIFSGYYFSGDGALRNEEGFYRITGRLDDVINVSGHRLGTAEIEDVMNEHPDVAETAVVGFPHDIKGEGVYAYVTLKEEINEPVQLILDDLKSMVRKQIAPYAVPEMIQVTPGSGLPKTRSGKIMRRILRKIAANQPDELGDISTLADPSVVEILVDNHDKLIERHQAKSQAEDEKRKRI